MVKKKVKRRSQWRLCKSSKQASVAPAYVQAHWYDRHESSCGYLLLSKVHHAVSFSNNRVSDSTIVLV